MAKAKSAYVCTDCGAESPKWAGQCGDCGAWNTLQEFKLESLATGSKSKGGHAPTGYAGERAARKLKDVEASETPRHPVGIGELDRVLGGGLVSGAVVLVGGDPGIGKSTLLLQTVHKLNDSWPCLYVTGEESLQQLSLRAQRLNIEMPELHVMAETCVEQIVAHASSLKPRVVVIDSIQTMFSEGMSSAPGAVSQLRETAAQVVRFAKQTGTVVLLVGHVTKEGAIAGPRVLEHMVDTVLYFENDGSSRYRVIRSVKNRFGAANEIGVFAMLEEGLKEVRNPSAIFLSRHDEDIPGSVVTVAHEGSRPILAEVQALVDEGQGHPRRVTLGLDQNRLHLLLAVLHRHAGYALGASDVFVNVVGGIRLTETAPDLAVVLACLSSFRGKAVASDLVVFGELGLAGEVRPVPHGEQRIREAARQGFKRAIVPMGNKSATDLGIEVVGVRRLSEALDALGI